MAGVTAHFQAFSVITPQPLEKDAICKEIKSLWCEFCCGKSAIKELQLPLMNDRYLYLVF